MNELIPLFCLFSGAATLILLFIFFSVNECANALRLIAKELKKGQPQ